MSIDDIEARAKSATPTPEGHPLPNEYVVWCDTGSTYTASGTVHDARFLATAPEVVALCARARELEAIAVAMADLAESFEGFTPGASDLHPNDIDRVARMREDLNKAQETLRALGVEP